MLRRRGKGEASFLHYKSPGREETGVMNRGRGLRGGRKRERETKERRREDGKTRGDVETEVGQKE